MIEGIKNIWIYGAGKIGRKLLKDFNFLNISINGIVISNYDGTRIMNTHVYELSEVTSSPEETLFIITSAKKYHNDIIFHLKKYHFEQYIIWDRQCLCELWKRVDYRFTDRRAGNSKCCFILAGYKEFLWNDVFERFACFIPKDVDVCIVSSGVYSKKLEIIAQENGWSYLSTDINSVTLAQNIAFSVYENYEWVYKIDEDMFLTDRAFEKMFANYQNIKDVSNYEPGIVVPLIPVNGFGYYKILTEIGKKNEFERRFGRAVIGGNPNSEIEKNPESAVFMWNECPQIDRLNKLMEKEIYMDSCSVRFSIGCILLRHALWDDMQGFTVSGNADMGTDEEELCAHCVNTSRPIMVSNNAVVGHFAFGRQTSRMKEFYSENSEWFKIKTEIEGPVAIYGFRKNGRNLYKLLIKKKIRIVYIVERNYEALGMLEKDLGIPIVGFNEDKSLYGTAKAIILSGDLPEKTARECLELAGIQLPIVSAEME